MSAFDDYLTAQALVAPLLRFEPIGRRMLGSGWSVGPGNWVRYRGRRVALRPRAYVGTPNLTGAILVLAADLGCPALRNFHGARKARLEVAAVAALLLASGLVDPAEDDPRPNGH